MANNYFQFKEFIVYQDKCSMKVCTDSCLFGGWVSNKIADCHIPVANCLDIGTGTGLLSLMIAQKSNAVIDAVEIEPNASEQAKANFKHSPWSDRLNIFHTDVNEFICTKKYDLVISNPPFYEHDLLSPKENKNIARHDAYLSLAALVSIMKECVSETGHFAILLPYHRTDYFEKLAQENGFFLQQKLLVKQTPGHDFFRSILWFGKKSMTPLQSVLTIKDKKENYDPAFINLMQDYYLNG